MACEHLVVLLAELVGRRVGEERVAHEDADPFDAHAVGEAERARPSALRACGRRRRAGGECTSQIKARVLGASAERAVPAGS